MVGILDLLVKPMTPVAWKNVQAVATSKMQPLEPSSIVPYVQAASTNPTFMWIYPSHAPLALGVTFQTTAILNPNTTQQTIANFAPPVKNMSRPRQNVPFATPEHTKVPTLLHMPLVCRVWAGS